MINNKTYTNIRVIMDNLMQHDMLQDITLEQMVGYVIKFNGIFAMPQLYTEKSIFVDIDNYRGQLPCDLIAVKQVRETKHKRALQAISSSFFSPKSMELGFKTQGRIIFTTFKQGQVEIVYNAIPVDEEGYPLILDNERYKNALELYIKRDRFTKLFDMGKIVQGILQNTQQEYAWAAGQLEAELKMPSYSEWENISNAHNQLLIKDNEFSRGFDTTGIRENFKTH